MTAILAGIRLKEMKCRNSELYQKHVQALVRSVQGAKAEGAGRGNLTIFLSLAHLQKFKLMAGERLMGPVAQKDLLSPC